VCPVVQSFQANARLFRTLEVEFSSIAQSPRKIESLNGGPSRYRCARRNAFYDQIGQPEFLVFPFGAALLKLLQGVIRLNQAKSISIFLCGDVMTGRGIDQVLPHPAPPILYESYVQDAREYVQLAEATHGTISRKVDFPYIWGDALEELNRVGTDVRIINLETSITRNEEPWPEKGINYRMNPENVACITAARIDCCCLANNHTLDWGYPGLEETIETLEKVGMSHPGAGRSITEAAAPALITLEGKRRLLVFAFGSTSSGIPREWGATDKRPGLNLLNDLSEDTASRAATEIRSYRQPGDVVLASIHWGGNWGYGIPKEQIRFAHRLIEEGIDLVHGHSSHHFKAVEVYRERLILYGCGDFITDYEGISGYEAFRSDLALMYLVKMDSQDGRLMEVRLVPLQVRRFRLNRVSRADAQWFCNRLNDLGAPFATEARLEDDDSMTLRWLPS
jgi:poly-gamma-glutamate capsule biosynthesis protein CapA/YwtB (metallophosphatase superfamily)